MRILRRILLATIALALPVGVVPAAQAAGGEVTVMTRNLYLGADVGVALELLPDLPAAAQFMWDQVQATDFTSRAPVLAAEAARVQPEVIGIQEATTWRCRSGLIGADTVVYDFTAQFLQATADAGVPYVVASAVGQEAANPGYSIGPIPGLTMVRDPQTFQPLYGTDEAACGFQIADVLAVRADLADRVLAAGTSEYGTRYTVVPMLFLVDRGYAWADIDVDGTPTRFVTTHLESIWDPAKVPPSAEQARQLADDLAGTRMPVVVMGDFNSDPRDPRVPAEPAANPGGQPEASDACPAQPAGVTVDSARSACSAYWVMRQAGFADAGPDATDPANLTWGASALLAGPDPERVPAARAMGNDFGFTDRLDYVFTRGNVQVRSAELIGSAWPDGEDMWACDTAEQAENAQAAMAAMGLQTPSLFGCLPTDHAGVVATLTVAGAGDADAAPPTHLGSFQLGAALMLLLLVGGGVVAVAAWRA